MLAVESKISNLTRQRLRYKSFWKLTMIQRNHLNLCVQKYIKLLCNLKDTFSKKDTLESLATEQMLGKTIYVCYVWRSFSLCNTFQMGLSSKEVVNIRVSTILVNIIEHYHVLVQM